MKTLSKRLCTALFAAAVAAAPINAHAFNLFEPEIPALTDINGHWAEDSILKWYDAGIVRGDKDGNFEPNSNLTRAEFATIFTNLFGLTEKSANNYTDLTGNEWYADAILKCTAAGIMSGNGSRCNANDPVTREEAAAMLARALGIKTGDTTILDYFADGNTVSSWAKESLSAMIEKGIMSGVGNRLIAPNENIDRASAMKLLDNAIDRYASSAGFVTVSDKNAFVIVNAPTGGTVSVGGFAEGLIITPATTASVAANNISVDRIDVNGGSQFTVSGISNIGDIVINTKLNTNIEEDGVVASLEIAKGNAGCEISNEGKVENLIANDTLIFRNQEEGTLTHADINISGVIINGSSPNTMTVADGVDAPKNSWGQTVTAKNK